MRARSACAARLVASVDGVAVVSTARVPVVVPYNIPQRDCRGLSAGGAGSASAYKTWIRAFAAGIGTRRAIVVVEPDAVAGLDCLSSSDRSTRLSLLADASRVLGALPGSVVYLDGGHDAWQSVSVMASRLRAAGIADAQGFALSVSNFRASGGLVSYGQSLAAAIGVAHFVIDTSHNGLGPARTTPGATHPAGRLAPPRASRPRTATTGTSGSSALANPTAPATEARPPASSGATTPSA